MKFVLDSGARVIVAVVVEIEKEKKQNTRRTRE